MAFVNIPLFDNGTAFSDLTVFVCDFFLGSYPFSCFVIKYASGGNLDVRFWKQFPFAEYEMNVVKTVLTMKSTACRERMKCQTDTRKYPLSALDLTEHTSHRVRLVL